MALRVSDASQGRGHWKENRGLGRMLHMYINRRRVSQSLGSERVHSLAVRILCKEECTEARGSERAPRGTLKHVA